MRSTAQAVILTAPVFSFDLTHDFYCRSAYGMRMPPVKVEAFHELVSGDSSLKHDNDPNKLTSPK